MRYRIGGNNCHLGGNSSPELMDGQSTGSTERDTLINTCSKDVYETFFKGTKLDYESVDAGEACGQIRIGIEPSYMYQPLKMIVIDENKKCSYVVTGYAWGAWGTSIRQSRKFYAEYKRKSKFVRFIDKWHPLLFSV